MKVGVAAIVAVVFQRDLSASFVVHEGVAVIAVPDEERRLGGGAAAVVLGR